MHSTRGGVVYVVTNDPVANGNAVLTYLNDGAGNLSPLPGSPFKTNGTGYTTKYVLPHFGAFDLHQNLMLSADAHRLFVTNGGSDSIAIFEIFDDGSLQPAPGSPFLSGGGNPVSIGLAGDKLYVVNKNDDPGRDMSGSNPNYTGFRIEVNGRLTPIRGSTVELETLWRSPTQALVVDEKFIYDGGFGSFCVPARVAQWGEELRKDRPTLIRSMRINTDGSLEQLPPLKAPKGAFEGGPDTTGGDKPDPLMFGLRAHPTEKLVYVSYVTGDRLGVYEYDDSGRLNFIGMTSNSGKLICWIVINKAGTRAYTTNNASDTLSVYGLSNPRKPVEMTAIDLKGHGHPYQLALSSDDNWLYIVKTRTFKETPIGDGSVLNVLRALLDRTVPEIGSSPLTLPVRDDLLATAVGAAAH